MFDIIIKQKLSDAIQVDGKCYEFIEFTEDAANFVYFRVVRVG